MDIVLRLDFDAIAIEEAERILGKVFVEHGKDLGSYVVDCYLDIGHERWVELLEILVAEVEELGRELDAGGWILLVAFEACLTEDGDYLRPPPTMAKLRSWARSSGDVVGREAVSKPGMSARDFDGGGKTYILEPSF